MNPPESPTLFDVEAFTLELDRMVADHIAAESVVIDGYNLRPNRDKKDNEEQAIRGIYEKIICFCADALLESGGSVAVYRAIMNEFAERPNHSTDYHHMWPGMALPILGQIVRRVAQRANGKDESLRRITASEIRGSVNEILEESELPRRHYYLTEVKDPYRT